MCDFCSKEEEKEMAVRRRRFNAAKFRKGLRDRQIKSWLAAFSPSMRKRIVKRAVKQAKQEHESGRGKKRTAMTQRVVRKYVRRVMETLKLRRH